MKKALVVGLNDYPECELKCCSNDANSISDLLEANGDGSPNFDVKRSSISVRNQSFKQQ